MATARTGGDVDAWCGKCNLLLAHTVEAMVGTTIKRVHCNTCGSQHAYRPHAPGQGGSSSRTPREPREPKEPKARASSSSRSAGPGAVRASDYEAYMKGRENAEVRRYSPKSRFSAGEVIEHPKFGKGVATALKDGDKIEILFPDGPRVLIHGR